MGRREKQRIILALVCAASVTCVTSVQAQGPEITRTRTNEQDVIFNDNNPCNGTSVTGQGHSKFDFTDRTTPNGNTDSTIKFFDQGQGTGSDGARYLYSFSNSTRERSSTPNYTITTMLRKHIVREGPRSARESYFQYERITTSSTTPPSREKVKEHCK